MAGAVGPAPPPAAQRSESSRPQDTHVHHLRHVLVPTTADAQQHDILGIPAGALALHPRDGMRRLECGDDSLESAQQLETGHRLVVAHRYVSGATALLEERVLRADARIVQTRRDGVCWMH